MTTPDKKPDLLSEETCLACLAPFAPDDMVLPDSSGGLIHVGCGGPEREGYVNLDTGDPIGPDEPIPTGVRYGDLPAND